jgi:hypothetical protein
MKLRYNIIFYVIHLYSPTHNLIVFHALYVLVFRIQNQNGKYMGSKLQSTLSSLITTFTDFAARQEQDLAGEFLKRLLTIIKKWR